MIRIFIGYDPREAIAYHVLSHSILHRASEPVSITPVALSGLRYCFERQRDPLQSTDFTFTRFLVPWLCNYAGWALFLDCDMLVLDDVAKLWELRDHKFALQCVKHDHEPHEVEKFLGVRQTRYKCKNWSSVMLFNNRECRALSREYVQRASGLALHQFAWLDGHAYGIGPLSSRWNHLVDYDIWCNDAAIVHYTTGGPWFEQYRNCGYAPEWFAERDLMLNTSGIQF